MNGSPSWCKALGGHGDLVGAVHGQFEEVHADVDQAVAQALQLAGFLGVEEDDLAQQRVGAGLGGDRGEAAPLAAVFGVVFALVVLGDRPEGRVRGGRQPGQGLVPGDVDRAAVPAEAVGVLGVRVRGQLREGVPEPPEERVGVVLADPLQEDLAVVALKSFAEQAS
ncbi:hypothetical protein PQR15_22750 [Streptomyces lydicus]|nr:hypothetical protein [Streptomyces lydicus]